MNDSCNILCKNMRHLTGQKKFCKSRALELFMAVSQKMCWQGKGCNWKQMFTRFLSRTKKLLPNPSIRLLNLQKRQGYNWNEMELNFNEGFIHPECLCFFWRNKRNFRHFDHMFICKEILKSLSSYPVGIPHNENDCQKNSNWYATCHVEQGYWDNFKCVRYPKDVELFLTSPFVEFEKPHLVP